MASLDNLTIEVGKVTFSNSSSENVVFSSSHNSIPTLMASYKGSTPVNVFVTDVSKTGATIETSSIINGEIHFHAISS